MAVKDLGYVSAIAAVTAAALAACPHTGEASQASGGWVTTIVRARAVAAATGVPVGPSSLAQPSLAQPGPARAGLPGGIASYYWQDQMTASGERFNRRAFTAAHKTLPIGSMVRVTHETTGRAVVVRINDRGPFTPGRVIDLSEAAAEQIGMTSRGLARVRLDLVR
jgi:rare lipoprotein A